MRNIALQIFTFLFVAGFGWCLFAQDDSVGIDFESDILPILESNCLRCHDEENAEGGYRIDNHENAMDYIEEGDAESSDFYLYLISDDEEEMMPPPNEGGPLDDSDIKLIKNWIDQGAQWPVNVVLQGLDISGNDDDLAEGANRNDAPGRVDGKPTILYALGLLHPATLHMPIGLFMAAGLFSLLSIRGNFVMSDCAYYCLWLGTLSAIVACLTGWWFAIDQHPGEYIKTDETVNGLQNMEHKLFWHRISAIVVTVLALLLCLFASSARNHDPDDGIAWKFGVMILAAGIGFVGHKGGELSWKESHYDELWEVVDEHLPGVIQPEEELDLDLDDDATGNSSSEDAIEGSIEDVNT